ncbi:hypothetical protein KDA_56470 [Dictyobacter alpinus]|uniref:FAD/NAD(P)-binding domain-containing protein n=1 Tax=Dictyobacter alpinus TaxID=2014873 RepID=A0A402BFJ7_9CHLR|nr:FAD-dependent oxidoreductase [Dictyobacter alpinus]GCE30163.1 hypothetical protein KDA_56470 [Dictyobacter alpinus]
MLYQDTSRNVDVAMQRLASLSEVCSIGSSEGSPSRHPLPQYAERVAVVGAGPAGLSASIQLVGLGYTVTLIEELPVLGGMMAVGIPDFRLAHLRLKECIETLHHPCLKIQCNTRLGRDLPFTALRHNHAAILLAIGLQRSQFLDVSGESVLRGVFPALTFLKEYHLNGRTRLQGDVIVIGGGIATIDVARVALHAGATSVRVCYPGLLADIVDVHAARQEGVVFLEQVLPVGLLGSEDVTVYGMHCVRVHSFGRDSFGRHCLARVPGSDFKLHTDIVIDAFGECADFSGCLDDASLNRMMLIAYPDTLDTNLQGVFAAGDVTGGYRSIQSALEQGQRAAISIHNYLRLHTMPSFL